MDHLPDFRNATQPYPSVPYLGTGDYSGTRFREYASSHGWDVEKLQQGDFLAPADKTPSSRAAFLQDWLYFGLLHELFAAAGKKPPRVQDLVQVTERGRKLTSRRLDGLVQKGVSAIARRKKESKDEGVRVLGEALDTASSVVRQLWRLQVADQSVCPIPGEVLLSVMILGSSIDRALKEVGLYPATVARDWSLADAARRSMQGNGWCRRDVALAGSVLSEVSMFCASHLQRGPGTQAGHEQCTDAACETRQTDEAMYRTRHVVDGCSCEFWRTDVRELQDIIRQGRIPYIELRRDSAAGRTRAALKSFRNSIVEGPYNRLVIFSHVWSDGLGNPRENALPTCQLARFYDMLCDSPWDDVVGRQMLESHQAGRYKGKPMSNTSSCPPRSWRRWGRATFKTAIKIWIDTLCVPTDHDTRRVAIGMLKRYYSFAAMTVVLDSELCALRHRQLAESELLLRIGLSGWMSRCWTMQEAIIAGGSLAVRFDDGWFPLMDAVAFVRQQSSTIGVNVMDDAQRARIRNLRKGTKMVCIPLFAAVLLCNSVQVVAQGCCNLVCSSLPRALWRAVGPRKNIKPPTASETLLTECKDMFAPISRLCQNAPKARPGDARAVAAAVERVVLSWHGLGHRNTSHAPDRFINFAFGCAKSDADFDLMRRLLALPPPDRLRAWLLGQGSLPSGLLFLAGPKMREPGFRWAPSDVHPGMLERDEHPASCARQGHGRHSAAGVPEGSLQLYKPGLLWEHPDPLPPGSVTLREPGSDLVHAVELQQAPGPPEGFGHGQLAIIFSRPPAPGHSVAGALLADATRRSDSYAGRFFGAVVVSTRVATTADPSGVVAVLRLAGHQKWIVS